MNGKLAKAALAGLLAVAPPAWLHAAVQVLTGPTPIMDGGARAAGDITVINEKLAFALAVVSPVPYGVPRGAIIDVAPVTNGKAGRDRVTFADFLPDDWSAWPNTFQRVEILERGPQQVTVRATRDWGTVTIATTYSLKANADRVEIRTAMTNNGAATLTDLLSGFTLWPHGGYLFAVPGLAGIERGKADGALSDRVVAYDEDWTIALHAPYFDHIGSSSRDLFRLHTVKPGETRTFDGWLQVGSRGDLGPILQAEIERKHLAAGAVRGVVTGRDGKALDQAVVVIEKQGKPYGWVLGQRGAYEVTLPVGDYRLYATAKGYAQTAPIAVSVTAQAPAIRDFRGLEPPGRIDFAVTNSRIGRPLDARIVIATGQGPLVEFLGRKTFFTELDRKGNAAVSLAPGSYLFTVSSGGGFLARSQQVKLKVAPGEVRTAKVALTPLFDPPATGWYAADLHHHADQAEAVTPPADLARSQLAAGLDLLFVSDHDSTANHAALQKIADRRGLVFIASMELSASWGHFNAYPLIPGQKLAIDTGTATIDELLGEARRQGAMVVHKLWDLWNAGHHYYLTAGTDTHDVWNEVSGSVRCFVHVAGKLTAQGFAQSAKAGHAYVSHGPLIFPEVMFGDELKVKPAERFALAFELGSVEGLNKAVLIRAGAIAGTETFPDAPGKAHVDFTLTTDRATWYAILVEDRVGRKAYSDPIWVDVVSYPFGAPAR